MTALHTLDHAPQVVSEWLNELDEDLGWTGKSRSYHLLREGLHAVRDFLTIDEAADLAAQLPVLIRGIYYEGWVPSHCPAEARDREDFLARLDKAFARDPLEDPERAAGAVFDLLRRHLSAGQFDQVRKAMRKSLQELWQ